MQIQRKTQIHSGSRCPPRYHWWRIASGILIVFNLKNNRVPELSMGQDFWHKISDFSLPWAVFVWENWNGSQEGGAPPIWRVLKPEMVAFWQFHWQYCCQRPIVRPPPTPLYFVQWNAFIKQCSQLLSAPQHFHSAMQLLCPSVTTICKDERFCAINCLQLRNSGNIVFFATPLHKTSLLTWPAAFQF